jgi:hypothetical protein
VRPTIYACTSAWRAMQAEHVQCMMQFMASGGITYHPVVGDALIERARAIGATRFLLDSTCDVLLMIDDDIIFRPDDALRICEEAVEHDIVVGVYPTRSEARCFPSSTFYKNQPTRFFVGDDLAEVRWGATGFMAVARRVIEKLAQRDDMPLCHPNHPSGHRFYPFFTPYPYLLGDEWIYLSEDYAFVEHAREEGFKCWMDPNVHLAHLGTYAYELYDMAREQKPRVPLRLTLQDDDRFKTELMQAAPQPVVELVTPEGLPLSRQQRRHQERKEIKQRAPALAG